jgi:hypothetical protein
LKWIYAKTGKDVVGQKRLIHWASTKKWGWRDPERRGYEEWVKNFERKYCRLMVLWPVTVAERSEACNVFARSEAGIVGSNPTQGMNAWYVYVFILCLYCRLFM